jgi:hypothetical protein
MRANLATFLSIILRGPFSENKKPDADSKSASGVVELVPLILKLT